MLHYLNKFGQKNQICFVHHLLRNVCHYTETKSFHTCIKIYKSRQLFSPIIQRLYYDVTCARERRQTTARYIILPGPLNVLHTPLSNFTSV